MRIAYRLRLPLLLFSFVYIVYTLVYTFLILPEEPVNLMWSPDTSLRIVSVVAYDDIDTSVVQTGDIILAVDGRPVERTKLVFPTWKSSYDLVIQRGEQTLTVTLPFPPPKLAGTPDFSIFAVALVMWISAVVLLLLANPRLGDDSLVAGIVFLTLALWVASMRAALSGVPGTWVIAHSIGFPLGPMLGYLGFLFGARLYDRLRRVFKYLWGISLLFGLVGLAEVAFLYPTRSIESFVGISWINLSVQWVGAGLLAHILILVARLITTKPGYLRRQIGVLVLFILFGSAPAILLGILPDDLFAYSPLWYGLSFTLLLLIPAGYIFVINRAGYVLDKLFINMLTSSIIGLFLVTSYEITLKIISGWFISAEAALKYAPVFAIPLVVMVIVGRKPLLGHAENLVYGRPSVSERLIEQFTSSVATHPAIETLQEVLTKTAREMGIPQAVVALFENNGQTLYLTNREDVLDALARLAQSELRFMERTALRPNAARSGVFGKLTWVSAAVPLIVRDEQIGTLLVSNPQDEPFINDRQLTILSLVAGVIAVGYDTIVWHESALELSARLVQERDQERKKISRDLHDEPLHEIVRVSNQLQQICQQPTLADTQELVPAIETLSGVITSVRQTCQGLRPLCFEHGLDMVINTVLHKFRQDSAHICLHANVAEDEDVTADEEVVAAIYYVCMEALNNVAKHAGAANVWVDLSYSEQMVYITITDDGKGKKDLNMSVGELQRNQHFGLIGMKERVRAANGSFLFQNRQPSGITVSLTFPIARLQTPMVRYAK